MVTVQNPDIAVVGHFSMDILKLPNRTQPYEVLGGAVAYVSLVTRSLGSTVAVFSKVGSDFPDTYLQQLQEKGVNTSGIGRVDNEQTTSFELTYNEDLSSRVLRLKSKGSPITSGDLPSSLNAKAIHIAPIDGEISYEVVKYLRGCGKCLSIDPQGMTRCFGADGTVTHNTKLDKRLLSLIDIYKSTFAEIAVLTEQSELKQAIEAVHALGPEIVIVTMGLQGSVLSADGRLYKVPVYCSKKVVDPTGAGDVFIGAFLNEYIQRKNVSWCACTGAAAASLVIEDIGTGFFGSKKEIYNRAHKIFQSGN